MSNIAARAGKVQVRVGGNTQDFASLVDTIPDGRILEKNNSDTSNPVSNHNLSHSLPHSHIFLQTNTPSTLFTADVLYLLGNVSSLVNVEWYLGVPLNDTTNLRLQIAEVGTQVLGDKLLGLQVGNEPDLYADH